MRLAKKVMAVALAAAMTVSMLHRLRPVVAAVETAAPAAILPARAAALPAAPALAPAALRALLPALRAAAPALPARRLIKNIAEQLGMTNVKVVPFTSSYLKNMNSEKYTLEMNVKDAGGQRDGQHEDCPVY